MEVAKELKLLKPHNTAAVEPLQWKLNVQSNSANSKA